MGWDQAWEREEEGEGIMRLLGFLIRGFRGRLWLLRFSLRHLHMGVGVMEVVVVVIVILGMGMVEMVGRGLGWGWE